MTLGEKLKAARLEAGLSQRALGDGIVTRNMLSQIENGSAKPSMATLQALAQRLKKPVSFFLGEEAEAAPEGLSQAIALLEKARVHLDAQRIGPAREALQQAQSLLDQAPDWIRRQALLLQGRMAPDQAEALVLQLPSLDEELYLRASAAQGQPETCLAWLALVARQDSRCCLLAGKAKLSLGEFSQAAQLFHQAEPQYPHEAAQGLEICYRELKDFEKAYAYACRNRSLGT